MKFLPTMAGNLTPTLSFQSPSGYSGKVVLEGRVNLDWPSGAGKSAIGLYLKEESARRLRLPPSRRHFDPGAAWKLELHGKLGLVEYIDGAPTESTLSEIFNDTVQRAIGAFGVSACPDCGGETASVRWEEVLPDQNFEMILVGVRGKLNADLRRHLLSDGARRELDGDIILRLEDNPKDSVTLAIFDVIRAHSEDLDERVVTALRIARGIKVENEDLNVEILLVNMEVSDSEERKIASSKTLTISGDFICKKCLTTFNQPAPKLLGGYSDAQFLDLSVQQAQDILAKFENIEEFGFEGIGKLANLGLGGLKLHTKLNSLPAKTRREVQLIKLLERRPHASLVYFDGQTTKFVDELINLGNSVVVASSVGAQSELPRLYSQSATADISPWSQLSKRIFLYQYLGLAEKLAQLFSSLPDARRNGLSEDDFRNPLCEACSGKGHIVQDEPGLGRLAITCESCVGNRVKPHLLKVGYLERNFTDLLKMSIRESSLLLARRSEILDLLNSCREEGLNSLSFGDEVALLPSQKYTLLEMNRFLKSANNSGTVIVDLDPDYIDPALLPLFLERVNSGLAQGIDFKFLCSPE